jgi:hypothetical protein
MPVVLGKNPLWLNEANLIIGKTRALGYKDIGTKGKFKTPEIEDFAEQIGSKRKNSFPEYYDPDDEFRSISSDGSFKGVNIF